MPLEIERKFLLADERWRSEAVRQQHMQQGYLGGTEGRASIRVRVEGQTANLNIKAAVLGAARAEYEYTIPLDEAREMMAQLCVGRVEKTRHYVERGPHTWEIDEFHGDNAGLVVAEIELRAEDEAFERPPWLGREVTHERRYYNHSLSVRPYCGWSQNAHAP